MSERQHSISPQLHESSDDGKRDAASVSADGAPANKTKGGMNSYLVSRPDEWKRLNIDFNIANIHICR